MNKNIEVLKEVLDVLEEEKKKNYDLVNENDFKIKQIDSYLQDLSKKEEDDFKVFSPRSVENVNREQIAADTSKKEKYAAENAEYQKKIEFLKNLINKVNIVIENLQIEKEKTVQNIDNREQEHLANHILNCVSFIVSDAERAKIELTAIAEKMKNRKV